ncbi:hypothetical protein [Streptomyces sp. NPDC047315]|uniref:hypothetical protein n=1 Tax=Streptomyces sp. NPDC047315 TaxID=3155142 RepID=UPI0033E650BE
MSRRAADLGTPARCPACRAPVIRQWVGTVAALRITANLTPIDPAAEDQHRTPNQLTWCLTHPRTGPPQLRWRCWPRGTCTHPVVTEHTCPPQEPNTLF